jgi:hypothetical protein
MRTKDSRSRAGVVSFLGAATLLGAAVVASAAGGTGLGGTDAGPPIRIPDVGTCTVSDEPCTMPNGCDGSKLCLNGKFGPCECAGDVGVQVASCTSCGVTGKVLCDGSCNKTGCNVTTAPCTSSQNGCTVHGTGTCVNGLITSCTGCSGTASCTTSCGSTSSATCTPSCGITSCPFPPEVCNGIDDDCNGLVDDGITCAACDAL